MIVSNAAVVRTVSPPRRSPSAHFYLTREVQRPEDLEDAECLLADTPEARQALDLFLGTHGWRRFVQAGPTDPRGEVVTRLDAGEVRRVQRNM